MKTQAHTTSMASFEDKLAALKSNAGSKNSRSPLEDPFYAESLIIQSKSIVGRMYSSNEYVRFKYECELNKLVKEYRVWLAEIKREEREIAAKLDAMRQEQRDILKERRDLEAIQLVAKTNREFINHYKRRGSSKRNDRSVFHNPPTTDSFASGHEKKRLLQIPQKAESFDISSKQTKLQKVIRLPKIVSKVDGVVRETKIRRTSLPAISDSPLTNTKIGRNCMQEIKHESYERFSRASRKPEHIKLVQGLLLKTEPAKENAYENKTVQPSNSIHPIEKTPLSSVKTTLEVKTDNDRKVDKSSEKSKKPEEEVLESIHDEHESSAPPIRKPRILSAPKSRNENREVLVMAAARPSSVCGTIS